MEIKDIIKQKRLERGYTMKELANKVGVSEATVSRWESGNLATMKHTKIMLLSNALGISPAALFTSAPEEPSSLALTAREEKNIKKSRQLDADGKRDVDDFTDMKLMQAQRKADEQWEQLSPEKEELKLG